MLVLTPVSRQYNDEGGQQEFPNLPGLATEGILLMGCASVLMQDCCSYAEYRQLVSADLLATVIVHARNRKALHTVHFDLLLMIFQLQLLLQMIYSKAHGTCVTDDIQYGT